MVKQYPETSNFYIPSCYIMNTGRLQLNWRC